MNVFEIVITSITYGITLFSFIHSMVSNYFYTQLRLDFKRTFSVALFLIFISSSFNFVSFFINESIYTIVIDILLWLSVFAIVLLVKVAFKEELRFEILGLGVGIFVFSILELLRVVDYVIFDGVKIFSMICFFILLILLSVGYKILKGVRSKNPNYISSDVYFGYRHMILGIGILSVVFIFKIFEVIGNSFVFYSIVFMVLILTIMYSRMNYTFFLRNKLIEENEKFMSLYKTVVDEIIVGKEIIDRLLPNRKSLNSLHFDKYFKPAVLVGGDFIDIIPLSDSKFIAYITDVAGHGVSAGIIVSMMKALLLKDVVEGYYDLPSLVKRLNSDFNTLVKDTGRYATLFIVLIDKSKKKFNYVSCGHIECIYWSSRLNEFFLLSSTAPILGLFNKIDAFSSEIDFEDNDYLLLISDGVFSIIDRDGKTLSYDDFIKILSRNISSEIMPNELMFKVSQEIENLMEGGQVMDDITMFFIKL